VALRSKRKPVSDPKQARSRQTRESIAAAAMVLFASKGFDATTTTMIAKKAKVSVGSVYTHFKDKYEIFLLGIEKYYERIYELLKSESEKLPPFNTLNDVVKLFKNNLRETFHVYCLSGDLNLEIDRFLLMDKRAYALHEKYNALEDAIIKKALLRYRDVLISLDIDIVVNIYHVFLRSSFSYIYRNRAEIDIEAYLDTAAELITSALLNRTSQSPGKMK